MEELLQEIIGLLKNRQTISQEWYSIKETAILTGLSADHIRRTVISGTLPASQVGTPARPIYRISRRAIEEWMKGCEAGAAPRQSVRKALPSSKHLRG